MPRERRPLIPVTEATGRSGSSQDWEGPASAYSATLRIPAPRPLISELSKPGWERLG
jgi:hypothetical protein